MEKLCLFCRHFVFEPGEPDWSDVTPGYAPDIRCGLGHWRLDMYRDDVSNYRRCQLIARTCPDFDWVEGLESKP